MQGAQGQEGEEQQPEGDGQSTDDMAEAIAEEIMEEFKEQWSDAMENLDTADAAFDDLEVMILDESSKLQHPVSGVCVSLFLSAAETHRPWVVSSNPS